MRFPRAGSVSDLQIKIKDFTAGDYIIIHINTFSNETHHFLIVTKFWRNNTIPPIFKMKPLV